MIFTPLATEVTYQSITLFKRAEINPTMLKLSSVAVQRESPAMIGIRARFTNRVDLSPEIQYKRKPNNKEGLRMTVNKN